MYSTSKSSRYEYEYDYEHIGVDMGVLVLRAYTLYFTVPYLLHWVNLYSYRTLSLTVRYGSIGDEFDLIPLSASPGLAGLVISCAICIRYSTSTRTVPVY